MSKRATFSFCLIILPQISSVLNNIKIYLSGFGACGRGMIIKEFENSAFALGKGQVSGIVRTQFGYHTIKRLE
ncbi:MAG: peptidylprolyl isomerase [Candidatus Micrarchaeota archaeon]|nr:peptidylprolyl isomerase [Candidatus Micrarchaeota archaeon]